MQQLDIWSIVPETDSNPTSSNIIQLEDFKQYKRQPDLKKAAKLRKLGDRLNKRIELCRAERSTHTAKKAREAEELYLESVQLEVVQTWLYQIAEAIEADCLPAILGKITNKVPLEILKRYCKEEWYPKELERWEKTTDKELKELFAEELYKEERCNLIKAGIQSEVEVKAAISALWQLPKLLENLGKKAKSISRETVNKEAKIQNIEVKVASSKIPGFYPTQDKRLHSEIINCAELKAGMLVLEPHGGQGDLIEAISRECQVVIETGEINETLFKLLQLKGFNPMYHNFLEAKGLENRYDRVIGNPPWGAEFKPGIELKHIRKMYESAKPEIGKVITLVPSYLMRNQTTEYVEFQEWLEILEADIIELPKDCFAKNKIGRTLSSANLLIIDKPLIFPVVELATRLKENFKGSYEEHLITARKLFKLSRTIYKKALIGFNERTLTQKEKDEIEELEKEVTRITDKLGTEADILSDIRGYIIKIKMLDGRYNCLAGKGWWGI